MDPSKRISHPLPVALLFRSRSLCAPLPLPLTFFSLGAPPTPSFLSSPVSTPCPPCSCCSPMRATPLPLLTVPASREGRRPPHSRRSNGCGSALLFVRFAHWVHGCDMENLKKRHKRARVRDRAFKGRGAFGIARSTDGARSGRVQGKGRVKRRGAFKGRGACVRGAVKWDAFSGQGAFGLARSRDGTRS